MWNPRAVWILIVAATASAACAEAAVVRVDDAFAKGSADGQTWTIGTDTIEATYECRDGRLRQTRFVNRLTKPDRDYVSATSPCAPFGIDSVSSLGPFSMTDLWSAVVGESPANPAGDNLQAPVKKGDLIGFCAGSGSDDSGASVVWAVTLEYGDGERYVSSDDAKLDQGPVWFYYTRAPGSGYMDLLGETIPPASAGAEMLRVPSGYRAPGECPKISPTGFHLANAFEMVRAWKAPKDGVVSIQGEGKRVGGSADVRLSVVRIEERDPAALELPEDSGRWEIESGSVQQVAMGGRPAVELKLCVRREALRATLHVQAYPGTSILRQWVEIENAGSSPIALDAAVPFIISTQDDGSASWINSWMYGGTSRPNQGLLESATVEPGYRKALLGEKTDNYVPWMALQQQGKHNDGCFIALDYLGTWTIAFERAADRGILSASLPEMADRRLAPKETLRLPLVTVGVFQNDLDDMGRRLYDWQYQYLWDYTNSDYYAKTKWAVAWFFCSRNLQEQFTARLAHLDMDTDLMRTLGIEMLWDDAGWSKYPGWPIPDNYGVVFSPTHEGPDFSETLRYLEKSDMEWLLWMAGRPSAGLLDTKIGSWGNFQWRTDGFGRFSYGSDGAIREQIEHFLTANPRCSFHTCDGGSRYAHEFEIQRYADVNYLSDGGRGDQTNHYFSYLDPPDKWLDGIDILMQGSAYIRDTAPAQLSMVPLWAFRVAGQDQERLRRLMEIYRYLRQEGVVGRWSYMMHPTVKGDKEVYYDQRISRDGKKACLIRKHKAETEVTVFPRGLLPRHAYTVGFEYAKSLCTRTGADLMANGVVMAGQGTEGIAYLGLPDIPGNGRDQTAPTPPGRVFARSETNLGHSGVGIYWSPGTDNNWIRYYEVRRGETTIGKASVGIYYFDHSNGWDPAAAYAVRTVDGDGNASAWTAAEPLPGGTDEFWALGGLFSESGRDGWSAETTTDGHTFTAMTWVAPAKSPAGDFGGTPNQPGGVEGYWEGAGGARVGRGWQQASREAACVRSWTAPKAGMVRIVGRVMRECYRQAMGQPLRAQVLRGETHVWPDQDWAEVALGNLVGAEHDIRVEVAQGDVLRFVLDRGSDPETDIVAWMPRISYVGQDAAPENQSDVVRILCGATKPYVDSSGNQWAADAFHTGGKAVFSDVNVSDASPTPNDQTLYQFGRQGSEFKYSIPVKAGLYTVRLKFAETKYDWSFERPFNVDINGRRVLDHYDVCQAARGSRSAHERVFRYVVPDADGRVVLRFTGADEPAQKSDQALVHAIEILPETRTCVRIDVGSDKPFVDWNSRIWETDRNPDRAGLLSSASPVSQASPTLYDQALYQTARSGKSIGYSIPVSPGLYVVHMKFAELWLGEAGRRPMNIDINGRRVRENWDPGMAAGQAGMAADIRAEDVTPDKDGTIVIRVTAAGANDAVLQAIEIE